MARRKAYVCDWHLSARASPKAGTKPLGSWERFSWDQCSDRRDRGKHVFILRLIKIWCSIVIRQEKEQPGSLSLGGFSDRCKEELILSSQFICFFEAGSHGLGRGLGESNPVNGPGRKWWP